MKKVNYLFVSLFVVAILFSCEKEASYDGDSMLKGKKIKITEGIPGEPVSDDGNGITPYIIPGKNPGGNRTCEEVKNYFLGEESMNPFLCGEKTDYNGAFPGDAFPAGLTVETDGIFVSFSIDDCIEIEGSYYKVGAVIVKGSNQANVYFYGEYDEETDSWNLTGTLQDSGLSAPLNPSGKPAGLSNLTFCFIECEQVEEIIAVKSYYQDAEGNDRYAVSEGTLAFPDNSSEWCGTWLLGYQPYTPSTEFDMIRAGTSTTVGKVSVDQEGIVTITLNDNLTLDESWVYVGSLWHLQNNELGENGCPLYSNYWEYNDTEGQSQTFFD